LIALLAVRFSRHQKLILENFGSPVTYEFTQAQKPENYFSN